MRRLLFVLCLTVPTLAFAAPPEDESNVRYKPVTEIDIGEIDVNGAIRKPLGTAVLEKRRSTFNPLLTLRADFEPEMLESVNQVR